MKWPFCWHLKCFIIFYHCPVTIKSISCLSTVFFVEQKVPVFCIWVTLPVLPIGIWPYWSSPFQISLILLRPFNLVIMQHWFYFSLQFDECVLLSKLVLFTAFIKGQVHSDVLSLSQLRGTSNPKDQILSCVLPEKPTNFNRVKAHSITVMPVKEIFIHYHYSLLF